MSELDFSLLSQMFPSELLKYFKITHHVFLCDIATKEEYCEIYLDENNVLPPDIESKEYESKGFDTSKRIQDFPIRGRAVFLNIRKRIWRHKETRKILKRKYSFVANGIKMTQELSDFLKYTH